MRVLHSAALLRPSSGMLNQMLWEQKAAQELGLPWKVKMYCPVLSTDASPITYFDKQINTQKMPKLMSWLRLRIHYYKWLKSMQNDIDLYVLRYYVHDPFQLWFIINSAKPVYLVHHSFEVPELAIPPGVIAVLRSKLEALIGTFTLPFAKGVIGVTNEIVKHQLARSATQIKSTYVYPNGILFDKIKIVDNRSGDIPELLFVANFSPWHGLDLLLSSINKCQEPFVLHLVGDIPAEHSGIIQTDERIEAHGVLNHQEILELSQRCWVGLASFALHRKKMAQACPLKVREYLLSGLPVYGSSRDVFPEHESFYKKGNEDINNILLYAKECLSLPKEHVSSEARKYIEKKPLLDELYSKISNDFQKK